MTRIITFKEAASELKDLIDDERLCGHGLGKLLYLHAVNVLGSLSTHYHDTSIDAKRAWESLIKSNYYETDFWDKTLTVYKKEIVCHTTTKM